MIKSKDIVKDNVKDNVKDKDKDKDNDKDTDYRWIKEVKGMFFHTLVESANVLMLCEQRQRQKQLDKDNDNVKDKDKYDDKHTNYRGIKEVKRMFFKLWLSLPSCYCCERGAGFESYFHQKLKKTAKHSQKNYLPLNSISFYKKNTFL